MWRGDRVGEGCVFQTYISDGLAAIQGQRVDRSKQITDNMSKVAVRQQLMGILRVATRPSEIEVGPHVAAKHAPPPATY